MAPAAVLLAAGVGRRMGGPKALLLVDGRPLVSAHVERLRELGCEPIVVVVRPDRVTEVQRILGSVPAARIVPSDTESMAASLSVGLGCPAIAGRDAIVVSPVDALPVRRETLEALLTAVLSSDVQVATPQYRGRGGHPIVARASLLQSFSRGYSGTLRDLIRSVDTRRCLLEFDDPAVVGDLDTPADLDAVRPGLTPSFALSAPVERLSEAVENRSY